MKSFGGEDEIGFREKADPSSYVIAPWINLKIHVWCIPYTYSQATFANQQNELVAKKQNVKNMS